MNKVLKAFAKIKTQPDIQLVNTSKYWQSELKRVQERKIELTRNEKEFQNNIKKAEEELKASATELSDVEAKKLQDEITKIFTLPIRDLKVVRTSSKTGYLPKILISTGNIKLAKFDPTNVRNADYFTQFVGRHIGRFIIQYDWSPQRGGPTIAMVNTQFQYDNKQSATIKNGVPCLGNIDDMVRIMFNKKEFFKLTETLLDYAENPIYGTPYVNWDVWFNRNKQQDIKSFYNLLLNDYPSHYSAKEAAIIESMITKKEVEVLKRDISKDPTYPRLRFLDRETHEYCHCDECLDLRSKYAMYLQFVEEHKNDPTFTPPQPTFIDEDEEMPYFDLNDAIGRLTRLHEERNGSSSSTSYSVNNSI